MVVVNLECVFVLLMRDVWFDVSGGNTGIGKATALDLAGRGVRVILACRNQNKAEAAINDIKKVRTVT